MRALLVSEINQALQNLRNTAKTSFDSLQKNELKDHVEVERLA